VLIILQLNLVSADLFKLVWTKGMQKLCKSNFLWRTASNYWDCLPFAQIN